MFFMPPFPSIEIINTFLNSSISANYDIYSGETFDQSRNPVKGDCCFIVKFLFLKQVELSWKIINFLL